jgi:hypothetical protein
VSNTDFGRPQGGHLILEPECRRLPLQRHNVKGSRPQLCAIGYLVKISSARLKALSIAASGAIPFFNTSNSATLNTCSASTSANCRVVGLVDRQGRTEERLLGVDGPMWVLLEPEWVALGHLGHRDRKTAEPALQILVHGDAAGALPLYRRAADRFDSLLGPDHPSTV